MIMVLYVTQFWKTRNITQNDELRKVQARRKQF